MKLLALLVSVFFFVQAWAQEMCPAAPEGTTATVRDMLKDVGTKFNSVEDFLGGLPKELTSNFLFMGESRSFQEASVDSPRVILTSPNADVRLSFNTDPKQRGYNAIELSIYDPATKTYEYKEIKFPGSTSSSGTKAKVHHDPAACTLCHGNPPKPNWDTYNYWAGEIPFNKDFLVKGSKETDWYFNYIDNINKKKGRFAYLNQTETKEDIQKKLDANGYSVLPIIEKDLTQTFDEGQGGRSVRLFDNVVKKNACISQKTIMESPSYPNIKYALLGQMNFCDMTKFFPDWYKKSAMKYFSNTLPKVDLDKTSYDDFRKLLNEDTETRQLKLRKDKDSRQRNFFENNLGSKEASDKEFKLNTDTLGLNVVGVSPGEFQESLGEQPQTLADLRFLLEPSGIDVAHFSPTVDSGSYAFADTFRIDSILPSNERDAIEKEVNPDGLGDICELLAKKSNEVLLNLDYTNKVNALVDDICKQNESAVVVIKSDGLKTMDQVIAFNAGETFRNKCASCHDDKLGNGKTLTGAPAIPFRDVNELEKFLNTPQSQLINLSGRIEERIMRPAHVAGAMPVSSVTTLSGDEKKNIISWLEIVKMKQGPELPPTSNTGGNTVGEQ